MILIVGGSAAIDDLHREAAVALRDRAAAALCPGRPFGTLKRRADPPSDFAVVLDHLAQVAAKAVLVELLAGLRVP